jgi:hypothetical protein
MQTRRLMLRSGASCSREDSHGMSLTETSYTALNLVLCMKVRITAYFKLYLK